MSIAAAPATIYARRPIRARLGVRSRMRAFVVGQTVFLLHDRFVTVGQLRSGDKGRVIALEGERAWVEFKLGRIAHKELVKLGDVGWVSNCPDPECATTTDEHKEGCALDMSADSMHRPRLPGLEPGRF